MRRYLPRLGTGKTTATSVEEYRESITTVTGCLGSNSALYKEPPLLLQETVSSHPGHLIEQQFAASFNSQLLDPPSHVTMAARIASIVLLGASAVFASPLAPRRDATVTVTASSPAATAWDAGAVHDYPIHASCNTTQHAYIKQGLDEAITICSQARDHILRWGNSSEIYQKYFGNSSTGEPLGWFTKIVDGDKSDVHFRCDNIDGNCNQKGMYNHKIFNSKSSN
jgi:hypothetical protein